MKAAYIKQTGDPDVIQIGDLDDPMIGPGQVMIRNHAVSVNPIDTYVRSGVVAFDLPDPFIVGCDSAGVVEAVADDVDSFRVGDRVWCTNQGLLGRQGTFAERIAVDADWCFPLPDQVDFETAAANALVGVTAHLGLFRSASLEPGETVLVIGGTGGVGSMVVQMAKAAGATVITTAGSQQKAERATALGADHVIDYSKQAIDQATKQYAAHGIDVFWETRRDPDFDMAVDLLAPRGRMVLMAGRDARPEFPVGPFYVKECSLHGFVMFKARPLEMRRCADDMNRWMAAGKLQANIAQTLPLAEAAQAHRLQASGDVGGKIVLTIQQARV
ncbi:NADPH:quinone reductase [Stieleria sp. TO1_6]|uniref:NADPH:quinone reductase n=1 Tax=Stieleria tagensis TaxID=2956795 RepID=UPI00209ACE48|nr:NADPH:quinone reductase [Stieleria tagensis]MCO8125477.1 NADPH:quinone reductase [Stieleria tagensis]